MIALSQLLPGLPISIAVSGVCLDCREVQPGDAFLALSGRQAHGLDFVETALQRGASCVLFEPTLSGRPAPAQGARADFIEVPGLGLKLGEIGTRFYADPSAKLNVIGVTGTNGKTSFVQLLSAALSALGQPAGSIGTLGTGLSGALTAQARTTPDALSVQRALAGLKAQGAQHVAIEVSSHALDQGRVNGVTFHTAVFTNLTRDHLDYHLTFEAYGLAKALLFKWPGLRHVIVNIDDPFGRALISQIDPSVNVLRVGFGPSADARLHGLVLSASGLRFQLSGRFGELKLESSLLGAFNAMNLAQVAVALHVLAIANADIERAISALMPVNGRMNALSSHPLVVIDYAHTPDALEQALHALRAHTHGALWLVFGCGGDRDAGKRAQMGAIAERLADRICVTSDNPRSEDPGKIVADILSGFSAAGIAHVELDRALAIARSVAAVQHGDALLIAGKGHETYQEIAGQHLAFDDAAHARAALALRAC